MTALIAGCGDVGTALGRVLASRGQRPFGMRRDASKLPQEIHPVSADLRDATSLRDVFPGGLDAVFYTAAADARDPVSYEDAYVRGLNNLIEELVRQNQSPKHFFFVSSTAVYAQSSGEWVNEESETNPVEFTGKTLLRAEAIVASTSWPSTSVRFAGIYGPSRLSLVRSVQIGVIASEKRALSAFTNRIHRDDCADVLAHLSTLEAPLDVYIGVDSSPVLLSEVASFLADTLGCPKPWADAANGDQAVSGKRCSNKRLLETGYTFHYPSYREGYSKILSAAD